MLQFWLAIWQEAVIAVTGSPGGGGTVSKAPDPVRPNRRNQVREMLADALDKVQRVDEPAIEAPKPRKKPAKVLKTPDLVTTGDGLSIVRAIEAKVQAAIEADMVAQAEALALEMALMAEEEADLELLLLAM